MKESRPIGIFDSGVGGLTVWKEIINILPNESIIYCADSKNCPYGPKSEEEIINLSIKNVEFLLSKNCKIIVVACNTATAAAIDILREKYKTPFIGMEPAVKPAALKTKTGHIGILATQGTFNGRLFKETSRKYAENIEMNIQIGAGLVELVENLKSDSIEAENLLKKYINPMIKDNVDQIVLGCTHYPFFYNKIKKMVGEKVSVINPSIAVAKHTKNQIVSNKLRADKKNVYYEFYTTGDIETVKKIVKKISNKKAISYYSSTCEK
ncbi:MAG: glutamate racemase [Bacteroidetes bacterium]|nr:MAG: glutamate racemase [Bacteroidota bacterium]